MTRGRTAVGGHRSGADRAGHQRVVHDTSRLASHRKQGGLADALVVFNIHLR
jgi:hypothetical protein